MVPWRMGCLQDGRFLYNRAIFSLPYHRFRSSYGRFLKFLLPFFRHQNAHWITKLGWLKQKPDHHPLFSKLTWLATKISPQFSIGHTSLTHSFLLGFSIVMLVILHVNAEKFCGSTWPGWGLGSLSGWNAVTQSWRAEDGKYHQLQLEDCCHSNNLLLHHLPYVKKIVFFWNESFVSYFCSKISAGAIFYIGFNVATTEGAGNIELFACFSAAPFFFFSCDRIHLELCPKPWLVENLVLKRRLL